VTTTESIQNRATLDHEAEALYLRYGALPWQDLPEFTRTHFRDLVRAGVDGAGQPLHGDDRPALPDASACRSGRR
jgi:hypothetical protein